MKKILILVLFLIVTQPIYATGTWYEGCEKDAIIYDISDIQNYANELKEKFYKKYADGDGLNGENYSNEVIVPLSLYMIEQQNAGKKGFDI